MYYDTTLQTKDEFYWHIHAFPIFIVFPILFIHIHSLLIVFCLKTVVLIQWPWSTGHCAWYASRGAASRSLGRGIDKASDCLAVPCWKLLVSWDVIGCHGISLSLSVSYSILYSKYSSLFYSMYSFLFSPLSLSLPALLCHILFYSILYSLDSFFPSLSHRNGSMA